MRLFLLAAVAVLPVVLACAAGGQSVTGYTESVATWVGADGNVLVRTWGEPSGSYTMPNGNVVYVYVTQGEVQLDKRLVCTYDVQQHADRCTIGGGEVIQFGCKTRFEVDAAQQVVFADAEGTACLVAPEAPAGAAPVQPAAVQAAPAQVPAAALPIVAPVVPVAAEAAPPASTTFGGTTTGAPDAVVDGEGEAPDETAKKKRRKKRNKGHQ